jgi:hypothetical protein
MRNVIRGTIALAFFTLALAPTFAGRAAADSAGTVHVEVATSPAFARYTDNPSPAVRSWLNNHVWRLDVYSPYFDSRTAWEPNSWVYQDAYALYTDSSVASQHREWILRDAYGHPLYIPWGCSNGSCPQFAADISSPAFRQWWIADARAKLTAGYRGLFVDDVNMEMRVGDRQGNAVTPVDPSTRQPMTDSAWRNYVAQFMLEIRSAFPGMEITHNAIWFAHNDAGGADSSIRSEISSANYVYLERGVNDAGLTGGSGPWSLNALLSYVDEVHALGRSIVLGGQDSAPQALAYNLASYFLVSNGSDGVSGPGQNPDNWYPGFDVNLGDARAARYGWKGLLRRDFSGGIVLVDPPGGSLQTVTLPQPMLDSSGHSVTSVTLTAASGATLRAANPPARSSLPPVADAAPTQTTVQVRPAPQPLATMAPDTAARLMIPSIVASEPRTPNVVPQLSSASTRTSGPAGQASGRRNTRARRRARRAGLARVGGSVRHATRGQVMIQLQVRRAHRWAALRRFTALVDPQGRFFAVVHLRAGERYRVRALFGGAPGYRPSRSRFRVFVMGLA